MRTSAPESCAFLDKRMASRVVVAPVCAITGTRPAVCEATVSTNWMRSSLLNDANSPVEPPATTPLTPLSMERSTTFCSRSTSISSLSANGVDKAVSTPRSSTFFVISFLLPESWFLGCGTASSGFGCCRQCGVGGFVLARQQAGCTLSGSKRRGNGSFGVQRTEVVSGQKDALFRFHQSLLQLRTAGEAVRGAQLPALDVGFLDDIFKAGQYFREIFD